MAVISLVYHDGPLDGTTTEVEEPDIADRRDGEGNRTSNTLKDGPLYMAIVIDMSQVEYQWYAQVGT